jgi:hypothetical protein
MARFSSEDVQRMLNNGHVKVAAGDARGALLAVAPPARPTVPNKFGARQVEYDGIRFQSTLEGEYYQHLKLRQQAGDVLFFLRQTPFHLSGGTKYTVDFTVFLADGSVQFVDVKGFETKAFIRSKKQTEGLYPVEITVVKRGDF